MERKSEAELLEGIPPRTWVALSADVLSSDGASFRTGPAKVLFKRLSGQRFAELEDVSADGKRFIFSVPDQASADESAKLSPLKVLLHWQGGLEAKSGNR